MAMGSKIELGRIVLYVFFPVAMFFYFNLPESYEDVMTQKKKELYPADEDCHAHQRFLYENFGSCILPVTMLLVCQQHTRSWFQERPPTTLEDIKKAREEMLEAKHKKNAQQGDS